MTSRRPSAPRVRSGVDGAHPTQAPGAESPRAARSEPQGPTASAAPPGTAAPRGTAAARTAARSAATPGRDKTTRARESANPATPGRSRVAGPRRRTRLASRPSARRGSGWSQARPERRSRPANGDRAATEKSPSEVAAPPAITLRTLALGLVLLVAFIVLAPTLRAYVTQREQIRQVNADLASVGANVGYLDQELGRWRDTGFVQAQARERLGFVRPGEVPYRVIDPQAVVGEDEAVVELEGLTAAVDTAPIVPWYLTMWESVVDAGEPLDKVDAIDILTGAPAAADTAADPTADGAADQ